MRDMDTNIGPGWAPHGAKCKCNECEVDRLRDDLRKQTAGHRETVHQAARHLLERDCALALLRRAVGQIESYKRAGWLVTPAACEEASDIIAVANSIVPISSAQR